MTYSCQHTPYPTDRQEWWRWAKKMARHSIQTRCPRCGEMAIWKKRTDNRPYFIHPPADLVDGATETIADLMISKARERAKKARGLDARVNGELVEVGRLNGYPLLIRLYPGEDTESGKVAVDQAVDALRTAFRLPTKAPTSARPAKLLD